MIVVLVNGWCGPVVGEAEVDDDWSERNGLV